MKRISSVFLMIVMVLGISNVVFGEDKIFYREHSVTFLASKDGRSTIKVTAQYHFNPARGMCECLSAKYDVMESSGYTIEVELFKQNPRFGEGGAVAVVSSKSPDGVKHKTRLTMRFFPDGKAEQILIAV